jgi:hypothetical protein
VYAEINGLKMLCEIHGTGDPVVLLHGAMSATATSFGPLLNALAQTRQVVAMEQQGHEADLGQLFVPLPRRAVPDPGSRAGGRVKQEARRP